MQIGAYGGRGRFGCTRYARLVFIIMMIIIIIL